METEAKPDEGSTATAGAGAEGEPGPKRARRAQAFPMHFVGWNPKSVANTAVAFILRGLRLHRIPMAKEIRKMFIITPVPSYRSIERLVAAEGPVTISFHLLVSPIPSAPPDAMDIFDERFSDFPDILTADAVVSTVADLSTLTGFTIRSAVDKRKPNHCITIEKPF